jgi:hypothetical protein
MNVVEQILGEARPANTVDVISRIAKSTGMKSVSVWSQSDGSAALLRDEDGQAYEITVRPAAYAKHPGITGDTGAGKGTVRPAHQVRVRGRDRSVSRPSLP